MKINRSIARELERQGMSRRGLARKVGMDPTRLCRYLNGQRPASMQKIEAMMRVLGMRLSAQPKDEGKAKP